MCMTRGPRAGLVLDQRYRQWPNTEPAQTRVRCLRAPTGHTTLLLRSINVILIDVDSTSQQRRVPSGTQVLTSG